MGKIMYRGQEYGGSGGGGEMPSCYDGLTEMLENEDIAFGIDETTEYPALILTGYSDIVVNREGGGISWGDTEEAGLFSAVVDMCDRIADLEESGGGSLPACYSELTGVLEDGDLRFNVDPNYVSMDLTGYHMRLDISGGHIYDVGNWGDTNQPELDAAIGSMCQRIADLEEGSGGSMPAEYDGFTWLLDNGYIEFNTEYVPYGIKIDNSLAALDLGEHGDIIKSGYWAGSTDKGISDSNSLIDFLDALCDVVNTTDEDLDNLEDTVGGLSDTVDTLRNDFDSLNEELAGFTAGYITFEDSNNMTFSSVDLHLDSSDIVNESGYWGAWEDEQTQESSDGFQTTSITEAFVNISKELENLEDSGGQFFIVTMNDTMTDIYQYPIYIRENIINVTDNTFTQGNLITYYSNKSFVDIFNGSRDKITILREDGAEGIYEISNRGQARIDFKKLGLDYIYNTSTSKLMINDYEIYIESSI